jgi:hypothetical protein
VKVDRHWAAAHKPKFSYSQLVLCVANRESGEPGSRSFDTINWHADGAHKGGLQYDDGTWEEAGGRAYAAHANEATPEQQAKTFYHFYPGHESRWEETAPFC